MKATLMGARPKMYKALVFLKLAFVFCIGLQIQAQSDFSSGSKADTLSYSSAYNSADAGTAFTAFRDWTGRYEAAGNTQAQLVTEGVQLARQRKAALLALAVTSPEKVVALAIPSSARAGLPVEVASELETYVSGTGDYTVACALPSLKGPKLPFGLRRTVSLNGQKYKAYVYGRREGETTKQNIPLHGVVIGDVIVLHQSAVRQLDAGEVHPAGITVVDLRTAAEKAQGNALVEAEIGGVIYQFASAAELATVESQIEASESKLSSEVSQPASPWLQQRLQAAGATSLMAVPTAASAHSTGFKSILIIRVDFSDLTGDPQSRGSSPTVYTASYVKNLADTLINPYYLQSSYGRTSLSNTVTTQLYRMPQTAASYAAADANDQLHADAEAAASADYNLSNFDRIVVLFSPMENFPNSQIDYGGLAEVGGTRVWVNGEWDFRVVAHELGHTYGLLHANLWQVTDGNPISTSGSSTEYGDDFDTMGANFANVTTTDFNPWFKNMIGWIDDNQVVTVITNGIYHLDRFDNSTGTGTLALKVVKNSTLNYWIGCKREFTSNASMQNGAYIVWGYNVNHQSDLLDMTTPGNNVQDAALALVKTFTDTSANISITPISNGGTSPNEFMNIQVDVGNGGTQPLASISDASLTEGNSGTNNMTFTVSLLLPAAAQVTVDYTTVSQTAVAGLDFVATNGTVTFAVGETNKTIAVPIIGDTLIEQNETFDVVLSNPTGGAILADDTGTGTIMDDDLAGVQDLVITPTTNVLQLVQSLIDTNSGIIVKSVTLKAHQTSAGTSAGTYQLLGASPHTYNLTLPGIVLSTGNVDDYETGLNTVNGFTTAYGVPADASQEALLDTITGGTWDHNDVTELNIYFDVAPGSNNVSFQVVFGSEEYPDYVGSAYVDGFGIFLNGTNIAFQGGLPINIDHPDFSDYLGTELNGVLATGGNPVMNFAAQVAPNSTNNVLTFIIADTSDDVLDTTVYISSLAAEPPPPVPVVSIFDAPAVVEGNTTTNADFLIQLSTVSTQQVSVAYLVANGSAKAGSDFTALQGRMVFPAGVTNRTLSVPINGDVINEPDESFSVVIYNPTNSVVGRQQAFTTIIDDDAEHAKISVGNATVTEGDSGTVDLNFVVSLSEPSGYVVTANYFTSPGTASVGLDYLPQAGTLAFEPGETSKIITVKVVGDGFYEGNETLFLNISSPTHASIDVATGTGTIVDNDTKPTVSIADVTKAEGDSGTTAFSFVVSLSNPTASEVSVDYQTVDGSATVGGTDYESNSGTLTFNPGILQQTVTVNVTGDLDEESNEAFTVQLSNLVNVDAGTLTATGTILNDDGPHLSISGAKVVEGAASTTTNAVFTVTLDKPNGSPTSVDYSVVAVSATAGVDYQTTSGSLVFSMGVTSQDITVAVNGDNVAETNETFKVVLSNVSNGSIAVSEGVGVIVDDDVVANLALQVSMPATNIYVGYPFTMDLVVTNQGVSDATNVVFESTLPAGFELVSSSFGASNGTVVVDDSTVRGTVPLVTNGGTASFSLILRGTNAGATAFDSQVYSDQFDNDTADNTVSTNRTLLDPVVTIETAGSLLVAESNQPANRGLDPGETVSMSLSLKNTGNIGTTNLVAILRSENGVTAIAGTKTYGLVDPAGGSVSNTFTFSVTGTGGSHVMPTLDLWDVTATGSNSLGSVSYDFQLSETGAYSSGTTINIPSIGVADVYPSSVGVSGLQGRVSKVTVQLNGITHGFPDDLDILLVAPNGRGVVLMSDAGGSDDLSSVNLVIDDAASSFLPDSTLITSGTYRPTNYGTNDMFSGAPAGPYADDLGAYVGIDPNGTWLLYVVDDGAGDAGSMAGWSLNIQTTIPADPVAELVVGGTSSPNPVYEGYAYSYTLNVTNTGPAVATGVTLTSHLPDPVSLTSSTPAATSNSGNLVTFDLGTLAVGGTASVTLNVTASSSGSLTNVAAVTANEVDLQPGNSTVNIVTRVNRATTLSPASSSVESGQFSLNLAGQAGITYVIEVSTNLVNWTPVFTNTTLSGTVSFTDTNVNSGLKFYRAVER